jgi:hypothetical protein
MAQTPTAREIGKQSARLSGEDFKEAKWLGRKSRTRCSSNLKS